MNHGRAFMYLCAERRLKPGCESTQSDNTSKLGGCRTHGETSIQTALMHRRFKR